MHVCACTYINVLHVLCAICIYTCIYIYIYVCVCACVNVCIYEWRRGGDEKKDYDDNGDDGDNKNLRW
jgi:hypothetical protein